MADPSELEALKASFRGAMATADALAAVRDRIEATGPGGEIDVATLELLGRVTAAHAIASSALRGLVVTMIRRRESAGS